MVDTAVKAGIPRQLAGNSYVDVLLGGDAVVGMAWSGDVTSLLQPDQSEDQDFQWVLPAEGGMLWTDNMVIPKAPRTRARPSSGSTSTTSRRTRRPSRPGSTTSVRSRGRPRPCSSCDEELAANELIFPTAEMTARLHQFRATTAEEETRWAEEFSKVSGP